MLRSLLQLHGRNGLQMGSAVRDACRDEFERVRTSRQGVQYQEVLENGEQ